MVMLVDTVVKSNYCEIIILCGKFMYSVVVKIAGYAGGWVSMISEGERKEVLLDLGAGETEAADLWGPCLCALYGRHHYSG